MTDDTGAVRRRTVIKRAAAGLGGALALVAVRPVGEAAADVCVETVRTSTTWLDACPRTAEAFDVPPDESGTAYEECFSDGSYWLRVDWNSYPDTWISEDDVQYC